MKVLKLVLKYKWYDMIEAGLKPEEYRSCNEYWLRRLLDGGWVYDSDNNLLPANEWDVAFKQFDAVQFYRAYSKNRKTMLWEFIKTDIGKAVPEWSDNWQGDVFRIKLGKLISKTN